MVVRTLWLMLSVVGSALLVIVQIKLLTGVKVSLTRGTAAFNNVAVKVETLVGLGRLDENAAQDILESVINALTFDLGWAGDDVDEAIREFQSTPFIVHAFENCGYKLEEVE